MDDLAQADASVELEGVGVIAINGQTGFGVALVLIISMLVLILSFVSSPLFFMECDILKFNTTYS